MVKLTSSDNQEFTVDKDVACLSVLIKNMLEDFGEDSEDNAIPLPNVTGQILAKGKAATLHRVSLSNPSPSFSLRPFSNYSK